MWEKKILLQLDNGHRAEINKSQLFFIVAKQQQKKS
jgi:hypothetical protein